jgi:hypothetical protein
LQFNGCKILLDCGMAKIDHFEKYDSKEK